MAYGGGRKLKTLLPLPPKKCEDAGTMELLAYDAAGPRVPTMTEMTNVATPGISSPYDGASVVDEIADAVNAPADCCSCG